MGREGSVKRCDDGRGGPYEYIQKYKTQRKKG